MRLLDQAKSWLKDFLASRGFTVQRGPAPTPFTRLLERYHVDLILDIGANTGQFGTSLRESKYRGRIVSFEPTAKAFAALEACAAGDPLWEVRNIGLGDYDGPGSINVSENSVFSSLAKINSVTTSFYKDAAVVSNQAISVRRLDSLFSELRGSSRSILLKCDTQGFEKRVLLGARESLTHIIGLHLELSYEPLYDDELVFDDMLAYVRESGFELVSLEPLLHVESDRILQSDGTFFRRVFPA